MSVRGRLFEDTMAIYLHLVLPETGRPSIIQEAFCKLWKKYCVLAVCS